jgi:hypothetical protein
MSTTEPTETNLEQLWDEVANSRAAPEQVTPPAPAIDAAPATEEPQLPDPLPDEAPPDEAKPVDEVVVDPALAEIRDSIARLADRQRNMEGHIGGLKTHQQQLYAELKAASTARSRVDNAPTQQEVDLAISSPAEWEELKRDYPEWANATEKLLDSRLSTVKAPPAFTAEQVEEIVAARLAEERTLFSHQSIENSISAQFPGWKEEVRSEAFGKWLMTQPPDIQALERSDVIDDAIRLLRAYDSAKRTTDPLIRARQQKLDAATALPKGQVAPKTKTLDDMTPEELWDHLANQREKARRQAE